LGEFLGQYGRVNSLAGAKLKSSTSVSGDEDIVGPSHAQKRTHTEGTLEIHHSGKARILIVEDNAFVRESIVNLIDGQADMVCCGEADSVASTPAAVTQCKPDLILMDLRFKDGEAFELMNSLVLRQSKPAILILSHHDEVLFAERALQAGAQGYVMKAAAVDELLIAIRTVLRGRVYLSPAMSARLVQRVLKPGLKTAEIEKWKGTS
jgi:DNA-binding NarL/FixJ family response regulator